MPLQEDCFNGRDSALNSQLRETFKMHQSSFSKAPSSNMWLTRISFPHLMGESTNSKAKPAKPAAKEKSENKEQHIVVVAPEKSEVSAFDGGISAPRSKFGQSTVVPVVEDV